MARPKEIDSNWKRDSIVISDMHQIMLKELKKLLREETGKKWSKSGIIRTAIEELYAEEIGNFDMDKIKDI